MITLWFSTATLMYCCSCCTSLVEVITLYGCSVALHGKDVVIQCILYIKTCHRMYIKILWYIMRSQGRIPHHHLLNLGRKSSQLKYSYVDKAWADIFRKRKKELDLLPPTSDDLQLHAMRVFNHLLVHLL